MKTSNKEVQARESGSPSPARAEEVVIGGEAAVEASGVTPLGAAAYAVAQKMIME